MKAQTAGADSLLRAKMDSLHNAVKVNPAKENVLSASDSLATSISQPLQIQDSVSVSETSQASTVSLRDRVAKADALMLQYRFKDAISEYQQVIESAPDTLNILDIEDKLLMAQNGKAMMGFASRPVVVAKQRFSLKDFFLFYPLKDKSWRAVPNQLDPVASDSSEDLVKAMYAPDGTGTLYYSAKDEDGIRNIYMIKDQGDNWTAPILINEELTSASAEIYPMLSPDGNTLYFASKGLYGMGGYDLYKSQWNKENKDWDAPENLGFPYSSPADDFLFMNTEDGKYSIFASNRECSKDSVYIYVLEYDSMPVRKNITDEDDIRVLALLNPAVDPSRIDNAAAVSDKMPDNADTKRYLDKMTQVRELREEIFNFGKALDEDRLKMADLEGQQKTDLMNDILQRELRLPAMNDSLSRAVKDLQKIEMDFLVNGFVIDPDKVQAEANREIVGAASGYTFSKNAMGSALSLNVLTPKREFDYTFTILSEGRFAEDNTLPSGVVYQIQIFSTSTPATVAQLKGLSPVFERMNANRHVYSAGLFRTYQDALSNLNAVRKAGFKNAVITAFDSGKQVSVSEARKLGNQVRALYTVKIYPQDGQSLSDAAMSAIKEKSDKDIARGIEDGVVVFMVGPFGQISDAEALSSVIKNAGESNVKVESTPVE